MAKQTKMNAELAKRVKELGINAKSEEEAREKLLEILTENGIEGMEEEDTDTLIEIAESFVEDSQETEDETEEETEEQTEEEEAEELAEEAAEEETEEEEEEEETEEEEGDEYDAMDRKEMKAFIAEKGLEVKVTKSKSDEDLRDEVRNAMSEKEAAAKKATKKSSKKEETKPSKKEDKKAASKKEEKPASKGGRKITKLSPKENKDDRQFFNFLKKMFPDGEYEYAWVTGGVSVKHVGKNGKRVIFAAKNCSMQENGNIKCNVYLPSLCKKTEVLDDANLEYKTCFSGDPFLNGVILQDTMEVFEELMPEMLGVVKKIDKKLGDNREKMEKELEKNKKPAKKEEKKEESKTATKKAVAKKEEAKPVKKSKK